MKSKFLIIVSIVFVVVIAGLVSSFYRGSNKSASAVNMSKKNTVSTAVNKDSIDISPQTVKDHVIINSATLIKNGFVVIRQLIDGKLGQIVEISQPLKTGTHKNITISLGTANVQNDDMVGMIYEDYGNDSIFNDFDMPALNENGNMIARDVRTGKSLPVSVIEGEDTAMQGMNMSKSMTKVTYTDKGFVPSKVEVSVGSMVEFINESSTEMWVASNPHPQHTDLPTFDQFRPYKQHSIYRYVFDKKGAWGYHDHLNASRNGEVVVN